MTIPLPYVNMTLTVLTFLQVEVTENGETIKHPIKFYGREGPLRLVYDENHRIKTPLKWNAPLNEVEIITEAAMSAHLAQPAKVLSTSFGYLVSSVDVKTGTVMIGVEWTILRGIEYKSMQERAFNADAVFEAARPNR